jgi:hypothetical protein
VLFFFPLPNLKRDNKQEEEEQGAHAIFRAILKIKLEAIIHSLSLSLWT